MYIIICTYSEKKAAFLWNKIIGLIILILLDITALTYYIGTCVQRFIIISIIIIYFRNR